MQVLKRGHTELFRRGPDECFDSLAGLTRFCQEQKEKSLDRWVPPHSLRPRPLALDRLVIDFGDPGAKQPEEAYQMNDWSFTQLCQLAKVSRDTVNRVTADTAWRVFGDTLPSGNKPLQLYTEGNVIRSIHGVSYTRLYNADILAMLSEFAPDFQPPQRAAFGGNESGGGTGLYAGEQDMFVFLIDPTGWAEIEGQAFAPGFFIWNSEVGKRSLGIQTFWFQAICQNHIVWDAVEVVEFTRKHTASMGDFYELFDQDAETAHKLLGLTLTTRDRTLSMAGFPHHQLEVYLHKLLKEGQRVAICEPVEESLARGPIRREVTRVVTPGTMDENGKSEATDASDDMKVKRTAEERPVRQPRHFVLKQFEAWLNEAGLAFVAIEDVRRTTPAVAAYVGILDFIVLRGDEKLLVNVRPRLQAKHLEAIRELQNLFGTEYKPMRMWPSEGPGGWNWHDYPVGISETAAT